MDQWFSRLARKLSAAAGSWQAFFLASAVIIVWVITGFFVGFDNTLYQLAINTGTTIVTFLMVFLLQSTQNHDTAAIHLKLAELIRASAKAHNSMIGLEDLTQEQLLEIKGHFDHLAQKAHEASEKRRTKHAGDGPHHGGNHQNPHHGGDHHDQHQEGGA